VAFNETRLSDDVERGAEGGPGFKTGITTRASGFETRLEEWSTTRGEWSIGYGIQSKTDFNKVLDAFYAQRGRLSGFRFKDWSDFELADQTIGTGDASKTVFQIFKRYTFGAVTFDRDLRKIVSGTVVIKLDTVTQADPADFSIDLNTGLVTMVVAPGVGADLTAQVEFDVPVRFDIDSLGIAMTVFNAGGIPNIPIVEIKLL